MLEQLIAIFVFGLVITGIVYLGLRRAQEAAERARRVRLAEQQESAGRDSGSVRSLRASA